MHSVVHCETHQLLHVKVPKHEGVYICHKLHMLDDTLIVRTRTIVTQNLYFKLHNKLRPRSMHFLWEVYRYSADKKSLLYFGIFKKIWHLNLFWATSEHSLKISLSKMQLKYYLPIYSQIFCGTCFLRCFQPILCSYFSFSRPAGLMYLDSVTPAIIVCLQGSTHLFQDSNLSLQYFDGAPVSITEVRLSH